MKTRIEIPEPCHQDWNKMTILEKGRYCESCNKTVIDFTTQTREQIIQQLNNKKNACGRFEISQLKDHHSLKTKNNYLTKWAILLGLGSILGTTVPTIASNPKLNIELREKSDWKSIFPIKTKKDSIVIKGKVFDSSGMPLAGVYVILKETTIGTQTNFDGEFAIEIPTNKLEDENYLVFSYIAFETKEYKFSKKDKNLNINIKLEVNEEMVTTGPVVIKKANIFDKIGYFFKNLFSKKTGH